mgnify:CR=1 FL=1
MRFTFRPSTPEDEPQIVALLLRAFGMADGPLGAFVRPDHLAWKYWRPHPLWDGARSYVLERGDAIVAHGAVWPIPLLAPHGRIAAIQLYDWAADPRALGAGLTLLRHVGRLADVICSIGGTETTQRMREPMGFRARNAVHSVARTIRPVAAALAGSPSWRTPLRVARALGRLRATPRPPQGWEAREVPAAALAGLGLRLPEAPPRGRGYEFERSTGLLAFLAECPSVRFRFFAVRRSEEWAGYFITRCDSREARLVDAWIVDSDVESLQALHQTIVATVHGSSGAHLMTAYASSADMLAAFGASGFRSTYEQPAYVYDPAGLIPADAVLPLQLAQTDYAFL